MSLALLVGALRLRLRVGESGAAGWCAAASCAAGKAFCCVKICKSFLFVKFVETEKYCEAS